MDVIILGARLGTGNIGEAIAAELAEGTWVTDDCYDVDTGEFEVPTHLPYREAGALVVTLGATSLTPMLETARWRIEEVIRACLLLPLEAIRRYVQARNVDNAGGKVIVIGSYAHDHPLTGCAPYCAAKAGLAAAIKELGWELTEHGYQFHVVHPYHVPTTPMGEMVIAGLMEARNMTLEEARKYQRRDLKLDDHLTPAEIAVIVHWLLTEPAAVWLSGQGLSLYGGTR